MKKIAFITSSFKKFLEFRPGKLFVIVLFTVILGFSQGISYILLVPILRKIESENQSSGSFLIRNFEQFSSRTGVPISFELLLILFVFLLLFIFVLQNRKAVLMTKYQQQYSGFIRKDFYRKLIFSDWSVLSKFSRSQHIQTITSEIPRVTSFYFFLLNSFTRIFILIIHFVVAFFVSWELSVIVLISGTIQFVLLAGYLKKAYELGYQGRKNYKRIIKNIDDFWITVKPAKIHNSEQFYFENFKRADDQFVSNQLRQSVNNLRPQLIYSILGLVNLVFIVYVAVSFFNIPVFLLIVFVIIFSRIIPLCISTYNDVSQMFLNVESVINLERMNFKSSEGTDSLLKFELKNRIDIRDIYFSYGNSKPVFENFSNSIPVHKMTGITGESGCGKTTLVDLVSGLMVPDSGEIVFDTLEMNRSNAGSLKKIIGYVSQNSLFIDGTIRENLLWDLNSVVSDDEIFKVLESVNIRQSLEQKNLKLSSEVTNFAFHFSAGELQRLALARILIRKPQLLILDEATSAMDEKNEDIILNHLKNLKSCTTIIFVTHKRRLLNSFDHIIELV